MKLIINTNRIIAALITDSISRKIIQSPKFQFYSINFGRKEVIKYKDEIMEKAEVNEEKFEELLSLIFKRINIIKDDIIQEYFDKAKEIMDNIDKDDTPFIAAALAMKCEIWSDDEHFLKQNKIKIFKTKDLIKFL